MVEWGHYLIIKTKDVLLINMFLNNPVGMLKEKVKLAHISIKRIINYEST